MAIVYSSLVWPSHDMVILGHYVAAVIVTQTTVSWTFNWLTIQFLVSILYHSLTSLIGSRNKNICRKNVKLRQRRALSSAEFAD